MDIAALERHRHHATNCNPVQSVISTSEGGRPPVFIHGLIANSLLWRHVISEVASEQRRCIAGGPARTWAHTCCTRTGGLAKRRYRAMRSLGFGLI